MSQQIKPKFVAGIVDADPNMTKEANRENPYAFWEIDTPNETQNRIVIDTYKKYDIDFVEHRIGKGFHYFGEKVPRSVWRDWHAELVKLVGNKEFPALTLRITRKYESEVFEKPVYHQVHDAPQDHHRALMYFLNKEMRRENYGQLTYATNKVGLHKYYKVVVYPLCPVCLISGYDDLEEHVRKVHGGISP